LKNVLYDHSLFTAEQVEAYGNLLKEKNCDKALVRLLRYREGDLISEQLRELLTPALLLWGAEDKDVPLSVGKRLAKDLADAQLIIDDQTGHLVTEERPREIYEQILAFTRDA